MWISGMFLWFQPALVSHSPLRHNLFPIRFSSIGLARPGQAESATLMCARRRVCPSTRPPPSPRMYCMKRPRLAPSRAGSRAGVVVVLLYDY